MFVLISTFIHIVNCDAEIPCFPQNKTGSYINFCFRKRIRAYFQGMFYFRVISSSGGCTVVEGRVSLQWGLFLEQGLYDEHPEKSCQGLFSGQVIFSGKQGIKNNVLSKRKSIALRQSAPQLNHSQRANFLVQLIHTR